MAKYKIEISATAERQIRKLDKTEQIRVLRAVKSLTIEPRPSGTRKLRGYEDVYRIRVGTHRVLYSYRVQASDSYCVKGWASPESVSGVIAASTPVLVD